MITFREHWFTVWMFQAKRRDDDIAIVTSCFAMRVSEEGVISSASFSYGGMAAWTISTPKTQAFLVGKPPHEYRKQNSTQVLIFRQAV